MHKSLMGLRGILPGTSMKTSNSPVPFGGMIRTGNQPVIAPTRAMSTGPAPMGSGLFQVLAEATLNIKSGWVRDIGRSCVQSNLTDQLLTSADLDWSAASKWVSSGLRYTRIVET